MEDQFPGALERASNLALSWASCLPHRHPPEGLGRRRELPTSTDFACRNATEQQQCSIRMRVSSYRPTKRRHLSEESFLKEIRGRGVGHRRDDQVTKQSCRSSIATRRSLDTETAESGAGRVSMTWRI